MTRNGTMISVQIPDDAGYLEVIRRAVRTAATRAGMGPVDALKMTMAVDEVCVNIIEHGYGTLSSGPSGRPIRVQVQVEQDRMCVLIHDAAPPFSPERQASPSLPEYLRRDPPKGLGLTIMRKFVDRVEHSYQPGEGNTVQLVKFLKQRATPALG